MVQIRFSKNGSDFLTSMMLKEAVRITMRRHSIQYHELSQLPYDIEMSDQQYLLFCLIKWDAPFEWRVLQS